MERISFSFLRFTKIFTVLFFIWIKSCHKDDRSLSISYDISYKLGNSFNNRPSRLLSNYYTYDELMCDYVNDYRIREMMRNNRKNKQRKRKEDIYKSKPYVHGKKLMDEINETYKIKKGKNFVKKSYKKGKKLKLYIMFGVPLIVSVLSSFYFPLASSNGNTGLVFFMIVLSIIATFLLIYFFILLLKYHNLKK
ncbi:Plasmodium exported protein, unknown function [Plasmodium gonderi]|uniref:Variable surface protein n=1 Tax=Plasmodium gonderi TaxID=77519 RepID=A0A1Y1JQN8_PLAGO|nr:Plasmodium exported protein, unknown function [Plasmodium gonderi]GAW84530.1 Plasmodium exported protein, unknown function [Plasmodium gonderi]